MIAGAGLGATTALTITAETASQLTGPVGMATFAGNLTGMVRSALGVSEQFGYGILDGKVTVSGGRITDVSVPGLQVAEPTSQVICEQAIPILRSEALSAQSARIDGVSGATDTSEACALSLQAALDELHVK